MSSIRTDRAHIAIWQSISKLFKTLKNVFSNLYSYYRLNNAFPRGYQRKGTALFYSGKLDEAI